MRAKSYPSSLLPGRTGRRLCFVRPRQRGRPLGEAAGRARQRREGLFWRFVFRRAREFLFLAPLRSSSSRGLMISSGVEAKQRVAASGAWKTTPQRAGPALGENRQATLSFPALVFFGGNETGLLCCLVGAGHFLSQQGDSPAGLLRVSGPVAHRRRL